MRLLVVESPAKAKTIAKYLDGAYEVKASVGHIRDLPKSNTNAIDIAAGFVPHYEITPGKEKVVSELRRLAKKADEVVLATDPDREGEAIAWHVAAAIGLRHPQRIVFNEITKEAVTEALAHPRPIDDNLRRAQEARRVLDRLFGYDLSGLVWKKLKYGLSAGRVQSPALRLLVEREKEIRAFIPEAYWVLTATVRTAAGATIAVTGNLEPRTEAAAAAIVAAGQRAHWRVGPIEESAATRAARPPFTTSTLQQAASSRLGYTPAVTMRLAQKLYEAGHITYMRTDSVNLSRQALGDLAHAVTERFGATVLETKNFTTKSKNAQEAHEAIRPTHAAVVTAGHTPQEKKLYQLIWSRAVASQMAAAKTKKTHLTVTADDSTVPEFSATGSRVIAPGWLLADPAARGEDVEIPAVTTGDPVELLDLTATGKETEPPRRYSEAGLVKELEKRGIGRPSTYAAIIKTLHDRGYAEKVDRSLRPTETGEIVSDFLSQHFEKYISDTFTAEMEDELDQIAAGERDYEKTLKDFYTPFSRDVKSKADVPKISNLGPAPADIICPTCGGPMTIKLGKSGRFYSCARFPDCAGARTLAGEELAGPKDTGERCPKCGEGNLVERDGRYGRFVACARYPKCKYIKKDAATESAGDTGVTCPVCGTGTMREKRGRYGTFYGCSNYPACKHIIKARPTGNRCPECNALMMEGTKTIPERCSNKACPNHRPQKLAKKN